MNFIYYDKIFTPALADGLSLEFKRQQVSSSFQVSFQYTTQSKQCLVWVVLPRPPIYSFSKLLSKSLGNIPSTPIIISVTGTYIFRSLFSFLARSMYLHLFSFSLMFTLWNGETAKSTIWQVLFFALLSISRILWPVLDDLFYLEILATFMRLILQDRFWFKHTPFSGMVQFKFLAQFSVDHLLHPVVSCFILFAAFSYYVINRFISIIT